jgi:nitrite reductase/ring-hydroxylating ferredoxin subunit
MAESKRIDVGTLEQLRSAGCLTAKADAQPVCVFWDGEAAYAVDDRCPHMGFPLHRGTVEAGLLTCHWHHARFDLASGGTLDPWADDVRAYPVEIVNGNVVVVVEARPDRVDYLRGRLDEGLEQGITLVVAKAVLGLLDAGVPAAEIVRAGVEFGLRNREQGWGAGLTVLVAMANVLPCLDESDRPLALVHGLSFLSSDTRGSPPRFPLSPLPARLPGATLTAWYRRFVDSRSGDAAERTLASAVASGLSAAEVSSMMCAAITDHVFIDEGHTLDFTNKAFECLEHLGWTDAGQVLPSLVHQTASAQRFEEESAWRHPVDLVALLRAADEGLAAFGDGGPGGSGLDDNARLDEQPGLDDKEVGELAWRLLGEEPADVVASVDAAIAAGATGEQLGRAVAYGAALRITRFHTQNDHGDWNEVHHGFTAANALHQSLARCSSPELLRGVYQGALRVYLDRFLNIPAARLPDAGMAGASPAGDLDDLQACWDQEGEVDRAGQIVYGHVANGGKPDEVIAALGHALLDEDAQFHWFQIYEAAVRQARAWPAGSVQQGLILAGAARFLAAHTPTRRELRQVVRIAVRLRRGEPLYEESTPE